MVNLPRLDSLSAATERAFLECLSTREEGISRAQISAATGISKPAISAAAARMIEAGVIREIGLDTGRRGRVATLLQINPHRGHTIALALDSNNVSAKATDLCGVVQAQRMVTLSGSESIADVTDTTKAILAAVNTSMTSELLAVTISTANPVALESSHVVKLPRAPFPAGHFDIIEALNLDPSITVIDNDVNWSTLAEAQLRADDRDFFFVHVGGGIGAGLYLDGKVRRGAGGLVGELGYTRVNETQDLTEYLLGLGFGRGREHSFNVQAALDVLELDNLPDPVKLGFDMFARAVSNIIVVLNPATLILGGPVGTSPVFVHEVAQRVKSLAVVDVEVSASILGQGGPLRGAALDAQRRARTRLGF